MLRLKATKDGQSLEVAQFVELHNHERTEMEFQFHPKIRKEDETTEKEIAGHLQLNANRKLVQQMYKQKTGKNILMRDLHNIATRAKMDNCNSGSSSEVQSTSQATPRRQGSVLSVNQKFRKATGKLQKLAGVMAEAGMCEFNSRMELLTS